MGKLNDISLYYDQGNRAIEAELDWILHQEWKREIEFVQKHWQAGIEQVLEYGPGAGLFAQALYVLQPTIKYTGLEDSEKLCAIAQARAAACRQDLEFLQGDVRHIRFQVEDVDLTVAFSFLKHFALEEWDDILLAILGQSQRWAAFDVQFLGHDLNNGTEFNHVFVTEQRVRSLLEKAGHEEVARQTWYTGHVPDHGDFHTDALWTRRVDRGRSEDSRPVRLGDPLRRDQGNLRDPVPQRPTGGEGMEPASQPEGGGERR